MFISLFNTLKATGVPCSLRELLDLIAAVDKRLAFANMNEFYFLTRAILVKDEKHYDKFDRAFDIYFKGIESIDDILEMLIPDEWLKAEFENFRRRKSDEISKLLQFEGETVIKGFLPILDDLERMVESRNSSEESLLDGIELVKNKIRKFFEDLNVEPFGQEGEMMDPVIHEAMLTQEDKNAENDAILEVFEKGYTYRDKVIRHAKVIVNKK